MAATHAERLRVADSGLDWLPSLAMLRCIDTTNYGSALRN